MAQLAQFKKNLIKKGNVIKYGIVYLIQRFHQVWRYFPPIFESEKINDFPLIQTRPDWRIRICETSPSWLNRLIYNDMQQKYRWLSSIFWQNNLITSCKPWHFRSLMIWRFGFLANLIDQPYTNSGKMSCCRIAIPYLLMLDLFKNVE